MKLNRLDRETARAQLLACCGATRWAEAMVDARPFDSEAELFRTADALWAEMEPSDLLEAFAAHPRIGDVEALRGRFAHDRWAGGEQAGASEASEAILEALAQANHEYERRFGYIFIVCATGKSAQEMLDILRERLPHRPEDELAVAAEEQRKITHIRLRKLLDAP